MPHDNAHFCYLSCLCHFLGIEQTAVAVVDKCLYTSLTAFIVYEVNVCVNKNVPAYHSVIPIAPNAHYLYYVLKVSHKGILQHPSTFAFSQTFQQTIHHIA